MATIHTSEFNDEKLIKLSRREALSLVSLLTAQLAGEPLDRHSTGECPSILVFTEGGAQGDRYTFGVERGGR